MVIFGNRNEMSSDDMVTIEAIIHYSGGSPHCNTNKIFYLDLIQLATLSADTTRIER